MKYFVIKMLAFSLILASTMAIPATVAHAQATLNGTYANDDDSAKWVFNNGTGQFRQYKSINGNPGTIVTDFRYSLTNGGKTLNYTQTEIRLEDHPMGLRKQSLNKDSSEAIEIRANAIVIGGKTYTKKTAAVSRAAPAAPKAAPAAKAPTYLSGTYVRDDNSAKWVFGKGTGKFYQYKSINGKPGTIVTDIRYEIVNDGKTFNYTQTEIRLEDHPMGPRKQSLNKASTEQVVIRPNAFVIGGKIYTKE